VFPVESRLVRTLLLYAGAGVVYIVAGIFDTNFLLPSIGALAYLLVVVWLVPALVRRLRA
jgi:hypothetical protein